MITSFKLFESQYNALLEAKMWEDFKKFFVDFNSLDGVQMTDEIGQALFASDPSEQKMYTRWLGNMYKKYNVDEFLEIMNTLYDMLSTYHLGKQKLKGDYAEFKDINKIKNFEALKDVVNHIVENRYHISKESMKRARRIQTEEDYMQIHEDDEWQIIIPFTWAQSHFWAKGAKWCISANERANMEGGGQFQNYCENLDSGGAPIYIFHNKIDANKNHALHFGRGGRFEFQDYGNNSDNFNQFITQNRNHDFKGSLLNFWEDAIKNPSRYANLKKSWPISEILVGFISKYMQNESARKSNYSSLGNMILESETIFNSLKLDDKSLQDLLIPALHIGNMKLIDKIIGASNIDINKPLSNKMTPLMNVVGSFIGTDEEAYKLCEYLIGLGADGSGTRDNGTSNVVMECIMEDKKFYKTALLVSTLPNYDASAEVSFNNSDTNTPNTFLFNINIGNVTDSNGMSYEDFSTLVGNLVKRGLDINISKYGVRPFPTLALILIRYSGENSESNRKKYFDVTKAYLENGANPCIGFSLKPNVKDDKKVLDMINPNTQKELYDIFFEYAQKNGCA